MKIYFSGSIRGGRDHDEWYRFIVGKLGEYGEVLSEFVADKSLTSYGNIDMKPEEIYQRDISLIKEADVIVADVTVPSLGVGYEIAYAERLNKKIYCLYNNQIEEKRLSAMILGCGNCEVFYYKTREELSDIINGIF